MSDADKNSKETKDRDQDRTVPVVHDQGLVDFLMMLFYSEPEPQHFPERIELNVVAGRASEQLKSIVWQEQYAPMKAPTAAVKQGAGQGKPSREKLVALANFMIQRMQQDCDGGGQRRTYGVHAFHMSRGPNPYARFLKRIEPKGIYPREEGVSEEGEPLTQDQKFLVQMQEQQRDMFEMFGTLAAGMIDRYDRMAARDASMIERLQHRLEEANEQRERALDLQLDREEKRAMITLKRQATEKVIDTAAAVLPALVSSFSGGKSIIPATVDLEIETLKTFLKTSDEGGQLTQDDAIAAFGDFDDQTGEVRKPGVLRKAQAEILVGVSQGKVPKDELDKLMPGGAEEITSEQAMGLLGIFGVQRLAPLQLMFQSRQYRNQHQAQQQR